VRVVLCGAGHIGAVHAANLAAHDRVDELVVADLDVDRAAGLAATTGARPATTDEAFALEPDAVVIAAATPAHAGLVRRAVAAGIPCFCEKPLSGELDETVALVREVEAAGATVQVGFMRRFDAGIRALRGMVERGELGRVHTLHVATHDHEPPNEAYVAVSGGMFRDQLIHDFDMIRWVTASEVATVYATGAVRAIAFAERYGDVDTCALVLTMAGGELALIAGTRENGRGEDVRVEAIGSNDSAAAGLNARTPLRLLDPVGIEPGHVPYAGFIERFAPAYAAEIDHFLGIANGDWRPTCPPRDALNTLLVAIGAERSRAAGAPVAVQHAEDLL
jgi:myo-inositol 2-dehydrogenase/D-chiro-inositol 1-dehydrogenase